MRRAVLLALLGLLAFASSPAFAATTVYYFIVMPDKANGWAPVRFDFVDPTNARAQCDSARRRAVLRYGGEAVWSNDLNACVKEVQP